MPRELSVRAVLRPMHLRPRADALILVLFSLVQVYGALWVLVYQPFDLRGLDDRAIPLLLFYSVLFIVSMHQLFARARDRHASN